MKALYASVLDLEQNTLKVNLRLPSLSRSSLISVMGVNLLPCLVLVDSVLGMPHSIGIDVRRLIRCAAKYTWGGREYGMTVADKFYSQFLTLSDRLAGNYPRRTAEELASAHTVFKMHPFQRNFSADRFAH